MLHCKILTKKQTLIKSWGLDFIQLSTHRKAFQHRQYISIQKFRRVRAGKEHQVTSSWPGRVNWVALVQWRATQIYWMCFMQVFPLYPSSQFRGNFDQWPFVLGHLPISACFGIYTPFVFLGKNRIVEHLWLTNMLFDVICTDVAEAQDPLPFFGKTSHSLAGACKEEDNLFRCRPPLVRCLSFSE